ncbi:MAG: hypothetical protein PQJ59_17990 [Spirochaetales bacterium]|nr:hypothetical protein [Spirochaetales bacterium]
MAKDKLIQLKKEIGELLGQIDEEGLLFLKKQASTIIYNQTVLEINRKNGESLMDLQDGVEDGSSQSSPKRRKSKPNEVTVDMGGESRGYCNVVYGNIRVFFTLEELGTMIYIAEKAADKGDGGLLLYRWLKKERSDFLVENGIKSYPSLVVDKLAKYLASEPKEGRP